MKILQLCLRVPFPPTDGGAIAMFNMAEALSAAGNEIKLICISTRKHFTKLSDLPADFVSKYQPEICFIDTTVKIGPALLNIFSTGSYNIDRFYSPLMERLIANELNRQSYDAVMLESLFMAPYLKAIRKNSNAVVVLRAHNVESVIWERLARNESNIFKKWYLSFLAKRLKHYESATLNNFNGIIPITQIDGHLFREMGALQPMHVTPVTLDVEKYQFNPASSDLPIVFHLGSMDWFPNQEGVAWFVNKVLPLLTDLTSLKISLAGKGMPESYFKLQSAFFSVEGNIDDAAKFMQDKQIMIVPLFSGGGMRVKIIEGLAMGKTIISTTIGAEGIDYTNGKDLMIADTPEAFASAIRFCLKHPALTAAIGENARKLAQSKYDNKAVGAAVKKFIQSLQ